MGTADSPLIALPVLNECREVAIAVREELVGPSKLGPQLAHTQLLDIHVRPREERELNPSIVLGLHSVIL